MCKRISVVLVVMCTLLLLCGCQAGPAKTHKVIPEWSRGVSVGLAGINRPASLLADDQGTSLAWVGQGIEYARVDRTGAVAVQRALSLTTAHPTDVHLIPTSDTVQRLFWIDNAGEPKGLFLVRLDTNGQVLGAPTRVIPQDQRVGDYAVAPGADGSLDVFWSTEIAADGGVYHVRLSADDEVLRGHELVAPGGLRPSLCVDHGGMIHLIWLDGVDPLEGRMYYAVFDPQTSHLGPATQVTRYPGAGNASVQGPVLGLDAGDAYVLWAHEKRGGGPIAGEAQSYWVTFPIGAPEFVDAVSLDVPATARPKYSDAQGTLPYERLAALDTGWSTSFLYQPAPLAHQSSEVGVFFSGRFSTRSRTYSNIVMVVMSEGQLRGYQFPAQASAVLQPSVCVDGEGSLHLAWLVPAGFGAYEVYYASTSAAVRANLDRVTLHDLTRDTLDALWSLTPALGFFPPIVLLWTILSLVWVVGFYFVKAEGGLDRRSAQVALVVAVALYVGCKLFLMPFVILEYAPFLNRLPENLWLVSQLGTPVVTLLAALLAFWVYLRRVRYGSLIAAYFIIVFADALLSMLIYIPGLMAS